DATLRERPPVERDLELLRGMNGENLPRALRRLQGGVAAHESYATRVAAEIDRSQIGVAGDHRDIEGIDAKHFGHDVGENRIGPLPDLRRATEDRDAAAAVASQLHARMRHVVAVDRQAGARDVARAREPHAPPARQLAELLLPPRTLDNFRNAVAEAHRSDAQVVC